MSQQRISAWPAAWIAWISRAQFETCRMDTGRFICYTMWSGISIARSANCLPAHPATLNLNCTRLRHAFGKHLSQTELNDRMVLKTNTDAKTYAVTFPPKKPSAAV